MAKRKDNKKPIESKGTVRLKAFILIEKMLAKQGNMKKLAKAFQAAFNEDPVLFYKQFIRPTAEKELIIEPGSGDVPKSFRIIVTDGDDNEETQEEAS